MRYRRVITSIDEAGEMQRKRRVELRREADVAFIGGAEPEGRHGTRRDDSTTGHRRSGQGAGAAVEDNVVEDTGGVEVPTAV